MAEFPALPLWTDAYLADTADLNEREHGCYLILLMIAWRRPDCALPNDMKWMHRCLNAYCGGHLHGNRFNRLIPKLLNRFFELGSDEKWHQKRLEREMNFLREKNEHMRELARQRWAKEGREETIEGGKTDEYHMNNTLKSDEYRSDLVQKRQSRTCKINDLGNAAAFSPAYAPTPTPTEEREERKEDIIQNEPAKKYALEHGCVKLTEHHLKQWLEAFPNVSVVGELIAKEPWLSQQKSWFNAAAGWLAKAEREAKKPNGAAEKPAEYDAYWQKI